MKNIRENWTALDILKFNRFYNTIAQEHNHFEYSPKYSADQPTHTNQPNKYIHI